MAKPSVKSSTSPPAVCSVCHLDKSFCSFLQVTLETGPRTFESSIESQEDLWGIILWVTSHYDLTLANMSSLSLLKSVHLVAESFSATEV